MNLRSRITYSCIFFLLAMALILVSKPRAVFGEDGRPKAFGFGDGKTIFSFGIVTTVVAISTFYVFSFIDVLYAVRDKQLSKQPSTAAHQQTYQYQYQQAYQQPQPFQQPFQQPQPPTPV